MKEKWLEGPWEISPETRCISVRRVGPLEQGARYRVASIGSMDRREEIDIATANLIAAAPELWDALAAIVEHDECLIECEVLKSFVELERAKEVLNKARGEL